MAVSELSRECQVTVWPKSILIPKGLFIGKECWLNHDVQGQVIGSVSQYLLVVAYAITSHKSQALTVPAVVVHCTNEFVSGLIYVAASRVRSAEHLQMLNF